MRRLTEKTITSLFNEVCDDHKQAGRRPTHLERRSGEKSNDEPTDDAREQGPRGTDANRDRDPDAQW